MSGQSYEQSDSSKIGQADTIRVTALLPRILLRYVQVMPLPGFSPKKHWHGGEARAKADD
jgi:hypothetical protein